MTKKEKEYETQIVKLVYHLSKALDHLDKAEQLLPEGDYYERNPGNWDKIYHTVYNIHKHYLAHLGALRLENYKGKEKPDDDELMRLLERIR